MIKTKNLVKDYTNQSVVTRVLKNINLEVDDGEFISIIGPSGAGKSTLLYQMSLLDKPTNGEVLIDEEIVSNLSEADATLFRLKNFGFVFQDYSLIPELTAVENVMIPSLMLGEKNESAFKKAKAALGSLDMEHVMDHVPSKLSGGEQQRVSIARAITHNPKILFADEPTANLDSKHSLDVLNVLKDLNKNGQTIVMVTHEEELAKKSKRIIEIIDGKIVKDLEL